MKSWNFNLKDNRIDISFSTKTSDFRSSHSRSARRRFQYSYNIVMDTDWDSRKRIDARIDLFLNEKMFIAFYCSLMAHNLSLLVGTRTVIRIVRTRKKKGREAFSSSGIASTWESRQLVAINVLSTDSFRYCSSMLNSSGRNSYLYSRKYLWTAISFLGPS